MQISSPPSFFWRFFKKSSITTNWQLAVYTGFQQVQSTKDQFFRYFLFENPPEGQFAYANETKVLYLKRNENDSQKDII